MNYYKLDDKKQDKNFLEGKLVLCTVALTLTEYRAGKIKEGDAIVVALSNGSKYKGTINRINIIKVSNYAVGEIELVKTGA